MASPQRQPVTDLITLARARQFAAADDFFDQVRCIERHAQILATEESAALGGDGPPASEAIKFCVAQSRAFAARAVERVVPLAENPHRLSMAINLLGLTGPSGVLPQAYDNLVQSRLRQRDTALADFLDLFNHRLISLYYRAWAKYRPAVHHRPRHGAAADPFTRTVSALAGQPHAAQGEIPLFYAGHFARATRSASDMARLVSDLLAVPATVDAFIGQWLAISSADRVQIGTGGRGRNHGLANGVMTGRRVWDMQSKFALRIGPVDDDALEALLPGGARFAALATLLHHYAPSHLDIELRIVVRGERRCRLDGRTRLGRNAWLRSDLARLRSARIQLDRWKIEAESQPGTELY